MAITLSSNDLLTNIEVFSEIACLDGRAFGVITACDGCDLEFNECLQTRLLQNLISNQARVEQHVGYNLTPRYHEEEIFWDGSSSRIQLDWPGVVAVNVVEAVTVLDEAVAISPYVIEDAPVSEVDGYCIVELDGRLIDNPDNAIVRNADTNEVIPHQEVSGYPRRNADGNWLVALGKGISSPCDTPTVNVQHCKLMRVTMPTPECDGDVYAVYADTEEIIPFAKEVQVSGNLSTYWFRPWSLVDEGFFDSEVNLERGDFHKLVEVVDFICKADASANIDFTEVGNCDCSDDLAVSTDTLSVDILSSRNSTIRVRYSDTCSCRCRTPMKFKLRYRTDPSAVVDDGSLFALQEAIAYLTAAELPMSSCRCALPDGNFISDAQKSYGEVKINPFNGEVFTNIQFGYKSGQLIFAERLSKAKKVKKLIKL